MLLGVYFHIAAFHYAIYGGFIALFVGLVHYFRMPAFFLISGFFGALLYYRKGSREMFTNRVKRIGLPLIFTLPPIHILNEFSWKFFELIRKDHGYINSLMDSIKSLNTLGSFIPFEVTHHLWFLNFLMTISFIVFIFDKIFIKNPFQNISMMLVKNILKMPWIGTLIFSLIFGLIMSILVKDMPQGSGSQWAYWFWFLFPSSIKSFISFSFFYYVGWQVYHCKDSLNNLSPGRYFLFFTITWILFITLLLPHLLSKEPSSYEAFKSFPKKANEGEPQKVTFLVDMGENEVMSGLGGLPAVYLSVHQLGNPSGQKMKDIGGGIWSITLKLKPGVYDYKFRNGLHNEWSGSGWENGKTIGEGGCGYDRHSNRRFRVTNERITLGVFCWSDCDDCLGNTIQNAYFQENEIFKRIYIFIYNFGIPALVLFSISFFVKFFNKDSKRLKYLSDSSYWIYIIHLPLTIFIPSLFHKSDLSIALKFIISSIIVTFICFFSYHYFVRNTFIGEFLNGRKFPPKKD